MSHPQIEKLFSLPTNCKITITATCRYKMEIPKYFIEKQCVYENSNTSSNRVKAVLGDIKVQLFPGYEALCTSLGTSLGRKVQRNSYFIDN